MNRLNKTKALVLVVAALAAFAGEARTFDVTLWRGETRAARVPDFCELGAAPAPLSVRRGVLKLVRYAPEPGSLQRVEAFDRVVWDTDEEGPRVVEIAVPEDARPGTYSCGMMRVTVLDRVLPPPRAWKYYLDLWQHPWAVARLAKAAPFSKGHYDAMRPVYRLLATAGQKTITVPILDLPWDHQCFDAYHSLVDDADFARFDEYVSFCLDCGLGPDISCYSLCPWTLGKEIDAEALEARWGAFLDRFAAHLEKKGWLDRTVMAMDERAPEDVAKVAAFVRRHAPRLRIAMAGNRKPSDFKDVSIDIYAQILTAKCVTPEFLAEASVRRAAGQVTTFYVCCGPLAPNTFLESRSGEAFWCGAAPAFLGLDGFLRWAWNSWPQNPVADASFGRWRAGDTFLCYPGGQPSWRFLDLRNGIVVAEKARILREAGRSTRELDEVAKLFDVKKANGRECDFQVLQRRATEAVNQP